MGVCWGQQEGPNGGVFLALVSMAGGIGATVAVISPVGTQNVNGIQGFLIALIWIIIGAINISYARRP
jgi:hypothetical protein